MKYNYSKLLGAIREKCATQAIFAERMGMSERSLSLRLNNKREWKQDEIVRACEVLGIEHSNVMLYFFNKNVQ